MPAGIVLLSLINKMEAFMEKVKGFLKKKNIEISVKRYFIDALGAMAQGLFACDIKHR